MAGGFGPRPRIPHRSLEGQLAAAPACQCTSDACACPCQCTGCSPDARKRNPGSLRRRRGTLGSPPQKVDLAGCGRRAPGAAAVGRSQGEPGRRRGSTATQVSVRTPEGSDAKGPKTRRNRGERCSRRVLLNSGLSCKVVL